MVLIAKCNRSSCILSFFTNLQKTVSKWFQTNNKKVQMHYQNQIFLLNKILAYFISVH